MVGADKASYAAITPHTNKTTRRSCGALNHQLPATRGKRLNMLFAGSMEGAHRACTLLGSVSTCRALGVPAQAYLGWAFERLGTEREKHGLRAEEMTPAAFKAASG